MAPVYTVVHYDVAEWMAHPASTGVDLTVVAALMADFPHPWFFCGGWAIELFVGEASRTHKDVDIGIFRADQLAIQGYFLQRGWQLAIADSGVLTRWEPGVVLELPLHGIWCRNPDHALTHLEVLFNEGDTTRFRFRRNPALVRAGTEALLYSVDGLPYLAPEIALLYKAAHVELAENQHDFEAALPHLTNEQRAWLRQGLQDLYEHHRWLDQV